MDQMIFWVELNIQLLFPKQTSRKAKGLDFDTAWPMRPLRTGI